jgi:sulfatase modifying factor 1
MKRSQVGRGALLALCVALALAASGDGLIAAPSSVPDDQMEARAAGMVLIPAGVFQMGDSFGEGMSDERPVHAVDVSAFYMDFCEVTKGLWDEVATWAAERGYDIAPDDGQGQAADHPVYNVSWYEAVKWANARSEKDGLAPCYLLGGSVYRAGQGEPDCNWVANGYRLPTEAEWEKAARGGAEGRRFSWSDADTIDHGRANYRSDSRYGYDVSSTRGYHPQYDEGSIPYTSPVGSFAANGYGLYDMTGNVWEWCWDWYGEMYYTFSPESDPRGPSSGLYRTGRGGYWYNFAFYGRVAYRTGDRPVVEDVDLGFRLVRAAP